MRVNTIERLSFASCSPVNVRSDAINSGLKKGQLPSSKFFFLAERERKREREKEIAISKYRSSTSRFSRDEIANIRQASVKRILTKFRDDTSTPLDFLIYRSISFCMHVRMHERVSYSIKRQLRVLSYFINHALCPFAFPFRFRV